MNKSNLAENQESVNGQDPAYLGDDFGGRLDLTYSWDRTKDKLARQMYMPRGLRPKNAAFGTGRTRKSAPASTVEKGGKKASKKPTLTLVKQGMKVETRQHGITKETDLVDGRKFGKRIVTLRRKQGKRACQKIGKRLFKISAKNIGRGQVFYLSAAYGIMESR
jgi:hypothetical protein